MIVLDTHAWIWWVAGSKRLPAQVRRRIDAARAVGVCAISCWELAMLVVRGRLRLDRTAGAWVDQALKLPRVELLPLEPAVAVAAAGVTLLGGDPADAMIVATAKHHALPLVTADGNIAESGLVKILWK